MIKKFFFVKNYKNFGGQKERKFGQVATIMIKMFLLIFCSIVGVGFVSGAEIFEFFARFDGYYFWAIFVFSIFSFFVTQKILYKAFFSAKSREKYKTNNIYTKNKSAKSGRFLGEKRQKQDAKAKTREGFKDRLYNFTLFLDVFLMSGAMFSGLSYFIKNLYNNNYLLIFIFINLVIFILLFFGTGLLEKFDIFVLFFVIFISLTFAKSGSLELFLGESFSLSLSPLLKATIYPMLYVFMNYFLIQPLLKSSSLVLETKGECRLFALLFTLVMSSVLLIFTLFLRSNLVFAEFSMPFLEYFKSRGKLSQVLFCSGLLFALISTIVSCLLGVKTNLKAKFRLNNFYLTILSMVFGLLIGLFDFNFYVEFVYPTIGLINFFIFVYV